MSYTQEKSADQINCHPSNNSWNLCLSGIFVVRLQGSESVFTWRHFYSFREKTATSIITGQHNDGHCTSIYTNTKILNQIKCDVLSE